MRSVRQTAVVSLVVLVGTAVCALASQEFPVPPPPLSEDYYPCMENCHVDMETNPERRELDEHTDIELHHAEQFRWCLDCHDAENRDMLHLQSGERLDFSESYRLCGQCHGDKYRDWRAGIHGKRTGHWNGAKQYLLCAHCHDPHQPRYVMQPAPQEFPEMYREEFGAEALQERVPSELREKMTGWPLPPPDVPLASRQLQGHHGPAEHGPEATSAPDQDH